MKKSRILILLLISILFISGCGKEKVNNLLNEVEENIKESIEENNTFLWAKQIFKTKPNHEVSKDFKDKIKTVFHHLTKDELIEKLLAHQLLQIKNPVAVKTEEPNKKFKKK